MSIRKKLVISHQPIVIVKLISTRYLFAIEFVIMEHSRYFRSKNVEIPRETYL